MDKRKKYLTLFLSTLTISSFTFGGGYVIISLLKKKFTDELHWIEEKEMLNLAAIAQSAPGAVAVNAAILDPEGFSPVWAEAVDRANLVPVTDPDFNLLAVNPAEGFRAEAEFFALPPLTLGRYTGFVQAIRPRPIRRLSIELEINQHHGPEDRAADEAGKAALRQRVTAA